MAQSNDGAKSESQTRDGRETRGESQSDQSKQGNERSRGGEAASDSSLPGAAARLERIADSASSTKAGAYQGAMEAGFSIIIAMLLGYWADEHFDTAPRYLIVGSVIGFGSMVLRLMRMRNLLEDPDEPRSSRGADEKRDDD